MLDTGVLVNAAESGTGMMVTLFLLFITLSIVIGVGGFLIKILFNKGGS